MCEGMDILKQQRLWDAFKLEVKITAVLHRMFDVEYSLDTMRVMKTSLKLHSDV